MTKIEYKPHCANCGAIINEEVKYWYNTFEGKPIRYLYSSYSNSIEIEPYRCKNCGEIFNEIEVKMPLKMEDDRYRYVPPIVEESEKKGGKKNET